MAPLTPSTTNQACTRAPNANRPIPIARLRTNRSRRERVSGFIHLHAHSSGFPARVGPRFTLAKDKAVLLQAREIPNWIRLAFGEQSARKLYFLRRRALASLHNAHFATVRDRVLICVHLRESAGSRSPLCKSCAR